MSSQNRRTNALAAKLAGRILTGEWPEGHKLPADSALGDAYGVSRTVIREAFRLLSGKGLLAARPRIGTLVAPQSQWVLLDKDILNWLADCGALPAYQSDMDDIRLALEPSFAALAATRGDAAANARLQAALRALQENPDNDHETAYLTALYAAADNRFAAGLLPMACMAVAQRQAAPPVPAYGRLTAAIAQKDAATARACALQALIGA